MNLIGLSESKILFAWGMSSNGKILIVAILHNSHDATSGNSGHGDGRAIVAHNFRAKCAAAEGSLGQQFGNGFDVDPEMWTACIHKLGCDLCELTTCQASEQFSS